MSPKKHIVAAIGPGVIWEAAHWPALRRMSDQAEVRYVYDVNPELTRKAAEATGAKALESPDAIFEDSQLDVVSVCTPPFARADYAERACAAGKHLMMEKPMARTLEDALRIRQAVRSAGVKCFVPFGRAVHADWRKVVEIVRSGELGEPVAFHHIDLTTPYFWIPLNHWMHDQSLSGGPIFDFSIHLLELARACMGEAEAVYYGAAAPTGRVKSDDTATMLVNYENGTMGEFSKSWNFPPGLKFSENANLVVCREGVVSIGANTVIHTVAGARELAPLQPDPQAGRMEAYQNLFDAIDKGAPLFASEADGLRMNEILDAALRSRESGKREKVEAHP